ncbi:MAG TPA: hypothetical protein ENH82_10350 [bacterium]|nr:hypothetical protein [bacterium]
MNSDVMLKLIQSNRKAIDSLNDANKEIGAANLWLHRYLKCLIEDYSRVVSTLENVSPDDVIDRIVSCAKPQDDTEETFLVVVD